MIDFDYDGGGGNGGNCDNGVIGRAPYRGCCCPQQNRNQRILDLLCHMCSPQQRRASCWYTALIDWDDTIPNIHSFSVKFCKGGTQSIQPRIDPSMSFRLRCLRLLPLQSAWWSGRRKELGWVFTPAPFPRGFPIRTMSCYVAGCTDAITICHLQKKREAEVLDGFSAPFS